MYYFKPVSSTISHIQRGKDKIGTVSASRERPGEFVAVVDGAKVYAASAHQAFEAMTARLNRISLCGADDKDAARAVIVARNAQVQRNAEELNAFMGMPVARITRKRVHI